MYSRYLIIYDGKQNGNQSESKSYLSWEILVGEKEFSSLEVII